MLQNIIIFIVSLLVLVIASTKTAKYSDLIEKSFGLSKYFLGGLILIFLSILPETFIAIDSAIEGAPLVGIKILLISSITVSTLVCAAIIFVSNGAVKIKDSLHTHKSFYYVLLLFPLIFALDGYYSRLEGIILIILGLAFLALTHNKNKKSLVKEKRKIPYKNIILIVVFTILLLGSAHYLINSIFGLQTDFNLNSIFVSLFVVGFATSVPELFFTMTLFKEEKTEADVSTILKAIVANTNIIIGIIILINPFALSIKAVVVPFLCLLLSIYILFSDHKANRLKNTAYKLLALYIIFLLIELFLNI